MCTGVTISYIVIAMCQYPLAIAGFWAYGNKVSKSSFFLNLFTFDIYFLGKRFILYYRDFFTSQISSCLRQWFKNALLEYNFKKKKI